MFFFQMVMAWFFTKKKIIEDFSCLCSNISHDFIHKNLFQNLVFWLDKNDQTLKLCNISLRFFWNYKVWRRLGSWRSILWNQICFSLCRALLELWHTRGMHMSSQLAATEKMLVFSILWETCLVMEEYCLT